MNKKHIIIFLCIILCGCGTVVQEKAVSENFDYWNPDFVMQTIYYDEDGRYYNEDGDYLYTMDGDKYICTKCRKRVETLTGWANETPRHCKKCFWGGRT